MKRVKSFFLSQDDFEPDQEMVDAISVASVDSADSIELPSDRILQEIRSGTVKRGQFGIRCIFALMAAISLICAAPNLFGWNATRYWMSLGILVWMFVPGWVYLSCWAINTYQYSLVFHFVTVLAAITILSLIHI